MIAVNKKGISVMGMSAGQARLLSVTARLTDNELRSQMLTNTKLRLADKSSAASNEYMDALNTQQLMYTSYDGSGNKQSTALTANTIFTFADLKNQYAMVNSSGQILVSGTDAVNFQKSNTLSEFLECYGVSKTENPNLYAQIEKIYGQNYTNFYDANNIYGIYNDNIVNADGLRGLMNNFVTFDENTNQYNLNQQFFTISYTNGDGINEIIVSSDYANYSSELKKYVNALGYNEINGNCVFGNLLDSALDIIKSVPTLSEPQKAEYPEEPELSSYEKAYVDSLYTDTFMDAFNQYSGLYDEETNSFNVAMTANVAPGYMHIQDVLGLLMVEDFGSMDTNFSSQGYYPSDSIFNSSLVYGKYNHEYYWVNSFYGDENLSRGVEYDKFEDLRNEIWKDYDEENPTELQQALIDAYYFVSTISDRNLFEPYPLRVLKTEEDKLRDQEIYAEAEAYFNQLLEEKENTPSSLFDEEEFNRANAIYQAAKKELTSDYYEFDLDNLNWYTAPSLSYKEDYENPNISYIYEKMIANVMNELKLNGHSETYIDYDSYNVDYAAYEAEKEKIDQEYAAAVQEYNAQLADLVADFENSIISSYKSYLENENIYKTELDNINSNNTLIPDPDDSKYQWYKNLWYRMGGITDTSKVQNSSKYKELDPTLLNNSEWLQFALEQGIITIEQASYSENGSSKYPNMGSYDWTSIIYTNASDIVSVEDSAAIAKAEVEYENAIREIENEDKKIDQDLKKLDTEHTALQTEYESIKSVIDKNVERSFKAFS